MERSPADSKNHHEDNQHRERGEEKLAGYARTGFTGQHRAEPVQKAGGNTQHERKKFASVHSKASGDYSKDSCKPIPDGACEHVWSWSWGTENQADFRLQVPSSEGDLSCLKNNVVG